MSWTRNRAKYETIAQRIDPAVRLVTKDAWPWKVIAALAMVFSFGGITYRKFLDSYATTIGPIQGYPRQWEGLSERLLVHEARHTRQFRWMGLFIHPWVGVLPMMILYLLLPLPLGFAFFRWRFEIDADKAMYRWMLSKGEKAEKVRERARSFGARVCGGNYGWSWLIGGIKGFEKAAEGAIQEARRGKRS